MSSWIWPMGLCLGLLFLVGLPDDSFAKGAKGRGTITVELTGFENNAGYLVLALHNKPDAFPAQPKRAYRSARVRVRKNAARVVLRNVPHGTYAIAVFHDENANGKLDTNVLGMPKERIGASNNAKGTFGPPTWNDAKFALRKKSQSQRIRLHSVF